MRMSVVGCDDQTIEQLRHQGVRIGWVLGVTGKGSIVLSPETEEEWTALMQASEVLRQVLPEHTMRVDDDPRIKSDGHGGGELDGTRERNVFVFFSEHS